MGEAEESPCLAQSFSSLLNTVGTQAPLRCHFTMAWDVEQFRELGNLTAAGSQQIGWYYYFRTFPV